MTSTPHSLALGGLAGADAICQQHADDAKLPGTYVAFLAPAGVQVVTRLGNARGWIRTDGLLAVDEPDDIFNGKMRRPILYDENGTLAPFPVATGTVNVIGGGAAGSTCDDYTTMNGTLPVGHADAIGGYAVHDQLGPCSMPARLYCFGIDRNVPLGLDAVVAGRRMFTFDGGISSGGGLAGFDAACASAAAGAGLPGTYLALLATSTASAASRMAPGLPWVRLDGVPISATAAELFDGTPLLVPPPGSQTTSVFTGASSPSVPGTLGTTCQDWTSQLVSDGVTMGNTQFVGPRWFEENVGNCTFDLPVYCLEQ